MTKRERTLVIFLLMTFLVVVGGGGLILFVWQPLKQVWDRTQEVDQTLETKRGELVKESKAVDTILKLNPRLSQWQKISLPPRDPELKKRRDLSPKEQQDRHLANLKIEYTRYLERLLSDWKFSRDAKVTTLAVQLPPATAKTGPESKALPAYQRLGFLVQGEARYENFLGLMREFHRTPLLHHVRTFKLLPAEDKSEKSPKKGKRPSSDMFTVALHIETLVVTAAEERVALLPSALPPLRTLASVDRDYNTMKLMNLFSGYQAPLQEKKISTPEYKVDKLAVLSTIRVTGFVNNGRRWEASLWDQSKRFWGEGEDKKAEKRVNAETLTELKIRDPRRLVALEAKVLYVDSRQMILLVEKKHYRAQRGEFLSDVFFTDEGKEKPALTTRELEALGIKLSGKENTEVEEPWDLVFEP